MEKKNSMNETMRFGAVEKEDKDAEIHQILTAVYQALEEKGYNPVNQLVGYILSGDPTYITSYKNARSIIRKLERDELLEEISGIADKDALTAAAYFHAKFENIHPFADGNGRTGRLWQTLILRKWEPIFTYLPIESMILEHQADYYAALNAANTQGSATVFIEFMLEMILEALKNVYVKQHIKSPEDQLLVLLKSDPRMTIPVMAEHLGLSDRQIRRLIASLKAQNRLHREGSNKTGRWVVSRKSR